MWTRDIAPLFTHMNRTPVSALGVERPPKPASTPFPKLLFDTVKTPQATTSLFSHHPNATAPLPAQYLLLVGSGVGDRLGVFSSLPSALSHFLVESTSSRSSSSAGFLRCMKLQKPPRTQPSPELRRQQASRKSVTGESSQYTGRPAYQRELRSSQAFWAESSYLKRA